LGAPVSAQTATTTAAITASIELRMRSAATRRVCS
jgi:hypothetical protein